MPAYAGAGAASGENRTSQGGPYAARLRQRTARQDRDAATARPRLRQELCASRLAFTLSRTGTSKEDYCRAVGISSSTLAHPQQADAHVHLHPDRDRQIFRGHERVLVFGTVGGQLNPIDMIKRSDIEPYELRRIAFGAILTALAVRPSSSCKRAASVILSCPTDYYSPASAAWFLTRGCLGAVWVPVILLIAAGIACKVRSCASTSASPRSSSPSRCAAPSSSTRIPSATSPSLSPVSPSPASRRSRRFEHLARTDMVPVRDRDDEKTGLPRARSPASRSLRRARLRSGLALLGPARKAKAPRGHELQPRPGLVRAANDSMLVHSLTHARGEGDMYFGFANSYHEWLCAAPPTPATI